MQSHTIYKLHMGPLCAECWKDEWLNVQWTSSSSSFPLHHLYAYFHIGPLALSLTRTWINRTFKMTLIVQCLMHLKEMWLILHACWGEHSSGDLNYLPLSSSPSENPIFPCSDGAKCWAWWYLRAPSTVEEGSADMLTTSLLETLISAGSIVRPTPRLAECAASTRGVVGGGGGGYVWTAAPRQVRAAHAAKVNDRMLRQTLSSSLALRCSFWAGPVGGCCVLKCWMQAAQSRWTSSAGRYFMFWVPFLFELAHKRAVRWGQICSWSTKPPWCSFFFFFF